VRGLHVRVVQVRRSLGAAANPLIATIAAAAAATFNVTPTTIARTPAAAAATAAAAAAAAAAPTPAPTPAAPTSRHADDLVIKIFCGHCPPKMSAADDDPMSADEGAPAGAAAAAAPDPAAVADALKEDGTVLYKAGDYARAGEKYTAAIAAAPSAGLYLNRAAAGMMRGRYEEAARDCGTAVELDARNLKAYVRGAKALTALGRYDDALSLLGQGLLQDPRSNELLDERKNTDLAKQRVERAKAYLAEVSTGAHEGCLCGRVCAVSLVLCACVRVRVDGLSHVLVARSCWRVAAAAAI
jgi:tetratricopeptide (TPR) repeat protein